MTSLYPSLAANQPGEEMEMQNYAESGKFFVVVSTFYGLDPQENLKYGSIPYHTNP